jgi:phosphoenolpyruvate carboxykinase (GTP)
MEHHHGVPISAIIFGGRRAHLAPLVYQSYDWKHGVFVGATMASERTAAQFGKVGEVRRDPMAMLPFAGYNMADYFEHWLRMGVRMRWQPKIFHVNWFRQDQNGNYLWPGFGENLRIIEWILARCRNDVEAHKTAIGWLPKIDDIDMTGLEVPHQNLEKLFEINPDAWRHELDDIAQFLKQFGDRMPIEMWAQHEEMIRRLNALGGRKS